MARTSRDEDAFAALVEPHRRALHAHCYRMLGSVHDADDALQDALVGAWKGLPGFQGRSSLRSWLFAIATNASLRILDGRRRRALPAAAGPRHDPAGPLAAPLEESAWIEPYPDELVRFEDREAVELAYVAALQHLPPNQRAALLLHEVLGFSARETAESLGTSAAAVNSAVQRARATLERERPAHSQQATLRALGDERSRALVGRFVDAWNQADVPAIVAMLADDATFSMPPLPSWFRGRADIAAFLTARVFRSAWRVEATTAAGQHALLCRRYDPEAGRHALAVLTVLAFAGERIATLTAFLSPRVLERARPGESLAPPMIPDRAAALHR